MSDGAKIVMRDPRFSRLLGWVWAAIGGLAVSALLWVGSSINELNRSVASLVAQNQSMFDRLNRTEARDDRQDVDIRDLERSVSTLEGRNLRGGPANEPAR